jgi:GNAT superfamily N-acetyltransferase
MPAPTDLELTVRHATREDHAAVVTLTEDTWSDRGGDYLADVFPQWVADDGDGQRTFVAEAEGVDGVVGVVQAVALSEWEAWFQGMRVDPDHRGLGVSAALNDACLGWARDRGAAVGRLMVFSWNVAGLAASRANGFEPVTEFRWARPDPDPAATGAAGPPAVREAPGGAHACWTSSDAHDHLGGLGMDPDESWAVSRIERDRWHDADAVVAVGDPVHGAAYRSRTWERDGEDGTERWAEYGVGAWRDVDACRNLLAAVARDAAEAGADRTRLLIPETARHVSDVARAGCAVSDEPDFVLAAALGDA